MLSEFLSTEYEDHDINSVSSILHVVNIQWIKMKMQGETTQIL
jgi:hypothetical protein